MAWPQFPLWPGNTEATVAVGGCVCVSVSIAVSILAKNWQAILLLLSPSIFPGNKQHSLSLPYCAAVLIQPQKEGVEGTS